MKTSDGWIDVARRNDPARAGMPETLELVRQRLGDPAGDDTVLASYGGWLPGAYEADPGHSAPAVLADPGPRTQPAAGARQTGPLPAVARRQRRRGWSLATLAAVATEAWQRAREKHDG